MTIDNRKYELALARNNLTSVKVAERAGMSRQRLSNVLNQKKVTPEVVARIAKAVNLSVEEIIEDER